MLVNVTQVHRSKKSFAPVEGFGPPEVLHARNADALLVSLVADQGVLKPIKVKQRGDFYLIEDGNRRYDAAILCGLTQIPITL